MEARIINSQDSLAPVVELLRSNKLPFEDIRLANSLFLSYHDAHGRLGGSGGLEFYSRYALLRSVAVDPEMRGRSIGKHIVKDLLHRAGERAVDEVYLLTETARDFFLNLNFEQIERDAVPSEVKASTEFASVCPVSASVMVSHIV